MPCKSLKTAFILSLAISLPAFLTNAAIAETIKVSGHGDAPVQAAKKQKDQAPLNQKGLANAEQAAKEKAIRQAILQVFANQETLLPKLDEVTQVTLQHLPTILLDSQVQNAAIQNGTASVDVAAQIDAAALRALLESNFSLSAVADTEGKFKIFVLSYTLDGMDPNRARPAVTHEEVVDNQKGVRSSTFANSAENASANSSAASLAASASLSSKGHASANADASGQYSASGSATERGNNGGSGSFSGSSNMAASASASANWDVAKSAALDAKKRHSESASNKSADSGSSYDDTSHYYRKVVDYADPSKKGAALSNEVRAEIEGMMSTAGFDVATLDVAMMGREFLTEDDLVSAILDVARTNANVSPNDYVAIALNSFTPVSQDTHQYTSKVTYRVVRVRDGLAFLPAKDVVGDSGLNAVSDDMARTYAVKAAMMQVDDILPGEIRQALQKMQRSEKRASATASTTYVIVIDNATAFSASAPIRDTLVGSGFKVERSINGLSKTHTLTVTLNGKTGEDVMNAIEKVLDPYDVQTMDNQGTRVKVK